MFVGFLLAAALSTPVPPPVPWQLIADAQAEKTARERGRARAFFLAAASADLSISTYALSQGCREGNPVIGNTMEVPVIYIAITGLQYWAAELIRKHYGEARANRWLKIFGAVHVGAAAWNVTQLPCE